MRKEDNIYRHDQSFFCAKCGHKMDSSTPVTEDTGSPIMEHSFQCCINCGAVLVFTDHTLTTTRLATREEIDDLRIKHPEDFFELMKYVTLFSTGNYMNKMHRQQAGKN